MKTALLHYWLTNMRGGEKVLAALGEMLPDADIFTHAFGKGMREKGEGGRYEGDGTSGSWKGQRVTESFIARLPLGRKHPQAYLPSSFSERVATGINGRYAWGCFRPSGSRAINDSETLNRLNSGTFSGMYA